MTGRRLLTIPISHYCEKARWALERAGLPYREERHVQGVSRVVSRRAGGRGTLPVLICEAGVLAESEAILRYADAHLREAQRLFPDGADDVTALCRELDAGLGPDGRRWIYAHMFEHKELMLRFNDVGVPRWEDRMMRALWPVAERWGRRELALRPDTLERDRPRVDAAFDAIAARLRAGATAADLVDASSMIEDAGFTIRDDLVHGFVGGYLPPVLGTRSRMLADVPDFTFAAGMTVVVQPNVVTADETAGVQTGELLLVTEDGAEALHHVPRGLLRAPG